MVGRFIFTFIHKVDIYVPRQSWKTYDYKLMFFAVYSQYYTYNQLNVYTIDYIFISQLSDNAYVAISTNT
jgi:hypothetical protein